MRYLVLSLLCSIAVIAYIQRLGLQSADARIQAEFNIDTEHFAMLGTAFLIGYALFQIPTGWLADRFGSRNTLVALAILWSSIAACVGFCDNFHSLLTLWFVMGVALAGIFPCAAKAIGAWFPDTEKATASGLLGSFTMLGTAMASLCTALLLTQVGWSWQAVYVLYGSVGILWAIVYFLLVPAREQRRSSLRPMTSSDWYHLLTSGPLWYLCGQQFFRAGAMIFFINWFPKFLKEERGIDPLEAGTLAAGVNICALVGGILGGLFSDWLFQRTGNRRLSRQGIATICMIAAGFLVALTYFIPTNYLAVVLFCFAAFLATFGGVAGYTVAIELGGSRVGVVFSVMNMCGNFGAAIVNQVVGSLKERSGSWNTALFAVAIILVIDAVCWIRLNPRSPLFEEQHDAR